MVNPLVHRPPVVVLCFCVPIQLFVSFSRTSEAPLSPWIAVEDRVSEKRNERASPMLPPPLRVRLRLDVEVAEAFHN